MCCLGTTLIICLLCRSVPCAVAVFYELSLKGHRPGRTPLRRYLAALSAADLRTLSDKKLCECIVSVGQLAPAPKAQLALELFDQLEARSGRLTAAQAAAVHAAVGKIKCPPLGKGMPIQPQTPGVPPPSQAVRPSASHQSSHQLPAGLNSHVADAMRAVVSHADVGSTASKVTQGVHRQPPAALPNYEAAGTTRQTPNAHAEAGNAAGPPAASQAPADASPDVTERRQRLLSLLDSLAAEARTADPSSASVECRAVHAALASVSGSNRHQPQLRDAEALSQLHSSSQPEWDSGHPGAAVAPTAASPTMRPFDSQEAPHNPLPSANALQQLLSVIQGRESQLGAFDLALALTALTSADTQEIEGLKPFNVPALKNALVQVTESFGIPDLLRLLGALTKVLTVTTSASGADVAPRPQNPPTTAAANDHEASSAAGDNASDGGAVRPPVNAASHHSQGQAVASVPNGRQADDRAAPAMKPRAAAAPAFGRQPGTQRMPLSTAAFSALWPAIMRCSKPASPAHASCVLHYLAQLGCRPSEPALQRLWAACLEGRLAVGPANPTLVRILASLAAMQRLPSPEQLSGLLMALHQPKRLLTYAPHQLAAIAEAYASLALWPQLPDACAMTGFLVAAKGSLEVSNAWHNEEAVRLLLSLASLDFAPGFEASHLQLQPPQALRLIAAVPGCIPQLATLLRSVAAAAAAANPGAEPGTAAAAAADAELDSSTAQIATAPSSSPISDAGAATSATHSVPKAQGAAHVGSTAASAPAPSTAGQYPPVVLKDKPALPTAANTAAGVPVERYAGSNANAAAPSERPSSPGGATSRSKSGGHGNVWDPQPAAAPASDMSPAEFSVVWSALKLLGALRVSAVGTHALPPSPTGANRASSKAAAVEVVLPQAAAGSGSHPAPAAQASTLGGSKETRLLEDALAPLLSGRRFWGIVEGRVAVARLPAVVNALQVVQSSNVPLPSTTSEALLVSCSLRPGMSTASTCIKRQLKLKTSWTKTWWPGGCRQTNRLSCYFMHTSAKRLNRYCLYLTMTRALISASYSGSPTRSVHRPSAQLLGKRAAPAGRGPRPIGRSPRRTDGTRIAAGFSGPFCRLHHSTVVGPIGRLCTLRLDS